MRNATRFILALAGSAALGCGSDTASEPDTTTQLWSVTADHHAITLSTVAPNNTIQLHVTALTSTGAPIDDVVPVLSTSDSSISIGADGTITALHVKNDVRVIVTARYQNVTVRDTVRFNITQDPHPPVAALLRLDPPPGDSAFLSLGLFSPPGMQLTATILDDGGHPVNGMAVRFWSSDTTQLSVDPAFGYALRNYSAHPGKVMVYAAATAYGRTVTDSMIFTIGESTLAGVTVRFRTPVGSTTPVGYFTPDTVVIAASGGVIWSSNFITPIDVVFDDSTAAEEYPFFPMGSGNIPPFQRDTASTESMLVTRAFNHPGTYRYSSALYGTSGVIVVK